MLCSEFIQINFCFSNYIYEIIVCDLNFSCAGQTSPIKIDGVKWFSFEEMALATNNFSSSNQIGEGGYGQVYKGILVDGTHAAIKRARQGSLQGSKEFLTEIMLLSRLHHRNLVTLIGYCDEECEQVCHPN